MKKDRVWVVGAILTIVVVVGGGWVIGIAPQLAAAAKADANRISVEKANAANEVLLARLKRDYLGIDELRKKIDSLRVAVPASAEISTFVTELNTLANLHQVTVKSISVNDARPYAPLAPASAGSSDRTIAPTVTNPKITTDNFIVIPVQFSVTGDYSKVLDFVHAVQTGSRLFLVSTLATTGSTSAKGVVNPSKKSATPTPQKVDSTIGGYAYVLVGRGKP